VASSRGAAIVGWLAPLALAAAVAWTFAPALGAGFVSYDDTENLVGNGSFRGLDAHRLDGCSARGGWALPAAFVGLARARLRAGGSGTVGGLDPAPFHATNVALHVVAALAVYLLARRLFALRGMSSVAAAVLCSTVAALLFALHPLRVESVAWVTERRDVLSAPFFVLAVWCWLKRGKRTCWCFAKRPARHVVRLCSGALALFLASVDRGRRACSSGEPSASAGSRSRSRPGWLPCVGSERGSVGRALAMRASAALA
jgi:hypothetical protein